MTGFTVIRVVCNGILRTHACGVRKVGRHVVIGREEHAFRSVFMPQERRQAGFFSFAHGQPDRAIGHRGERDHAGNGNQGCR